MVLLPSGVDDITFKGIFEFIAVQGTRPEIQDAYELSISVPLAFPRDFPIVKEVGNKIPRNDEHHVNSDGSLCLGSRLRLLLILAENPTLIGFAENCLTSYLYSVSHRLKFKTAFIFGELAHGSVGELSDYQDILDLKTDRKVIQALKLLTMNQKQANRNSCPCGCGKKLGLCSFRRRLDQLRKLGRSTFFEEIFSEYSYLLQ